MTLKQVIGQTIVVLVASAWIVAGVKGADKAGPRIVLFAIATLAVSLLLLLCGVEMLFGVL